MTTHTITLTDSGTDTLEAYIHKYTNLVPFIADDVKGTAQSDPPSQDQTSKAISLRVYFSNDGSGSAHSCSSSRRPPSCKIHPETRSLETSLLIPRASTNGARLLPSCLSEPIRECVIVKLFFSFFSSDTLIHCTQNNLRLEDTFLSVEQFTGGKWTAVRSDSHPSTKFHWDRTNVVRHVHISFYKSSPSDIWQLLGTSTVTITW